ncbi:hypothetical protein TIFTF001_035207 [Ficus carica]|uniref:Cytochrome P450 n=1 Tax=Ficus carica TaxID=3494 RepID=A0AA88JBH3_FICCA|nr:hypothetical protein TIFTF001_035207 [Ficus carica]
MAISQLWKKYLWEDLDLTTLLSQDFPFFLFVLLLLLSLFFLFIQNKSSHQKLNLPPTPPRLPIIRNLHQLGKFPHRSLRALSEKYGPLMLLKLGQVPTLVISSPDLVAEIVNTQDVVFSNRPKTTATEFVREEEAEELVKRVRKANIDDETTINLSQMLIEASNNIVSRCILGQSYKAEDGSISRMGKLSKRVVVELMAFCVGDFFPSLKWVDVVRGFKARLRLTFRELDAFNNRLVQEHKTMKSSSNYEMKDFVDVLLGLQEDHKLDFELSQDQLKATIQAYSTDTVKWSIRHHRTHRRRLGDRDTIGLHSGDHDAVTGEIRLIVNWGIAFKGVRQRPLCYPKTTRTPVGKKKKKKAIADRRDRETARGRSRHRHRGDQDFTAIDAVDLAIPAVLAITKLIGFDSDGTTLIASARTVAVRFSGVYGWI